MRAACSSAIASRRSRPGGLRALEEALVVRGERAGAPAPRREDERAARCSSRHASAEVEHVRKRPSISSAGSPMTSAPRVPPTLAMASRGARPTRRGSRPPTPRAQDEAREDDARARREVERELVELLDGPLGDDDDAPHGAPRADGAPAHEAQVADGRRRGDRHERDVGLVLGDPPRDLARGARSRARTRALAGSRSSPS